MPPRRAIPEPPWTVSTTYADLKSYSWAVGFSDGQTFASSKLTGFHVRAVAGGN